jgi:hypothetical protein
MILAGMTGKAGAGKDTLADYLVREHGFTKLSFAGPLKAMLAAAGMPEPASRELKEMPVPGFDFTWREAAQKLGTEWGRALDAEIWTKVVEQRIAREAALYSLPGTGPRFVLSDVRFENEAAMIRRLGGKVLHVTGRAADLGANAGHASEAGIAVVEGDIEIDNSGFLDAAVLQLHYGLLDGAA